MSTKHGTLHMNQMMTQQDLTFRACNRASHLHVKRSCACSDYQELPRNHLAQVWATLIHQLSQNFALQVSRVQECGQPRRI